MDILHHNIDEEKSYIMANAIGNFIGDAIHKIIIWFLKNLKTVLFVILGGGILLIGSILASILWGKKARR